jgi:hypothetical protein
MGSSAKRILSTTPKAMNTHVPQASAAQRIGIEHEYPILNAEQGYWA